MARASFRCIISALPNTAWSEQTIPRPYKEICTKGDNALHYTVDHTVTIQHFARNFAFSLYGLSIVYIRLYGLGMVTVWYMVGKWSGLWSLCGLCMVCVWSMVTMWSMYGLCMVYGWKLQIMTQQPLSVA